MNQVFTHSGQLSQMEEVVALVRGVDKPWAGRLGVVLNMGQRTDTGDGAHRAPNQSLDRALTILEMFGLDNREFGIREMSRRCGLNKSIVHRLARTLAERGFLEQNPVTRAYRIGIRAFEVGSNYRAGSSIETVTLPALRRLADRHHVNGALGIRRGGFVIYVLDVQSSGSIVLQDRTGSRAYLHTTALGKVLLAAEPEPRARALVGPGPLPRPSPTSIGDVEVLFQQLAAVRRDGYAVTFGEHYPGTFAVGAPVHDQTGRVVAAISGACPEGQAPVARRPELITAVSDAARQVSRALGAPISTRPLAGVAVWAGERN